MSYYLITLSYRIACVERQIAAIINHLPFDCSLSRNFWTNHDCFTLAEIAPINLKDHHNLINLGRKNVGGSL